MRITIDTQELLFDIRNTSHHEVAGIADVEQRYRTEAGSDKMETIYRCLAASQGTLTALCDKILVGEPLTTDASNILGGLPEQIEFELNLTRRFAGREQAIADAFHAFLVDSTLSMFYRNVNAPDLSKPHTDNMVVDINHIDNLLYKKRRPTQ